MLRRLVLLFIVLASAVTVSTVAVGLSENFVDPCEESGHAWEEIFNAGATCTEEGLLVKQCALCGEKSEEAISALGHDMKVLPGSAIAPTCTTEGREATTECVRVGCDYEVEGAVVPVGKHDYEAVVTEPTCTEDGYTTYICDCGASYVDDEVDALGHAYGQWISVGDGTHKKVCANDSTHVVVEDCAGGTADCEHKAECSVCGGQYGETTAHVFDQEVVDDAYLKTVANCTFAACYYKSCVCGHFDSAISETFYYGDLAGHVYDREVAERDYLVSAATCTDKAVYNKSCVCGLKGNDTFEYGEALGHAWDEGSVTTPAGCESEGEMLYTCGNDANHTKTEVIEALGHAWDEGTVTTPAGCESEGEMLYTCGNDQSHTKTEVIAATGHTGSDVINTCANCDHVFTVDEIQAMTEDLAEGKSLTGKYQLSGTIASISGKNILINVSGSTEKFEITAYSTVGDAVANLVVGDVITVSGTIKNYYGTIEFDKPTLDSVSHTININESENGSVTANVEGLIANGTSVTLTVTPDIGYELDNFYVDGAVVEIENNTYTFVVEKSVKIEATFKVIGSQGEVVAETFILKHTSSTTTNMSGENDANTYFGLNAEEWSVVSDKNNGSLHVGLNKSGDFRLYFNEKGNTLFTVSSPVYTIKSIKISYTGENYSKASVTVNGNLVTAVDGEYTINANEFVIGNANTSNAQVRITQVEIKYVPASSAPACNHEDTEVTKTAQAPTCEVAGWTDEISCTSCGEVVTPSVALPLADHTEGEAVRENVVDSTCSAVGSYDSVVKCTVCDEELSREEGLEIAKKDHTEEIDEAVAPDCDDTGLTEGKHCSVCDEVIIAQQVVDALGHTESEVVVENSVEADCDTAGSYESVVYCSVCDEEISRTTVPVSALGHTPVTIPAVDPTCKETGLTAGEKCDVCGTVTVAQTIVNALGCVDTNPDDNRCDVCGDVMCYHTEMSSVVTAPTCTEQGYTTYSCECGYTEVKDYVDAIDHNISDWAKVDEDTHSRCCLNDGCEEEEVENHNYVNPEYVVIDSVLNLVKTCVCGDKTYEEIDTTVPVAVASEKDLATVIGGGFDVVLSEDVELSEGSLEITKSVNVDLNGNNVIVSGVKGDVCEAFYVRGAGVEVTITNAGDVIADTDSEDAEHIIAVSATEGAIVNIEGGNFVSYGCSTIYATTGAVINIYGGRYEAKELYYGVNYLLDIDESVEEANRGKINVYGGEFVGFDPANHTNDGTYTNKVANGNHSIYDEETDTYTVSAHVADEAVVENSVPADCDTAGSHDNVVYCETCGVELSRESVVDNALGHTEGEATQENVIEATCQSTGSYESVVKCIVCEEELSRTTINTDKLNHNYEGVECTECHATKKVEVAFEFGANSTAGKEGSQAVSSTYNAGTVDGYTLTLTNTSKVYDKSWDAMGNSALKLGTSSDVGKFTFTVPEEITSVVILVGQRSGKATSVAINGTNYTITKNSASGLYDEIVIDTTSVKTIEFVSGQSGEKRCLINTIKFIAGADCEHASKTETHKDATCTEDGYNGYKCDACGHSWTTEVLKATGHDEEMAYTEAKDATCQEAGNVEYYYCSKCECYFADAEGVTAIDNVVIPVNANNHTNIVTITGTPATCEADGKTDGEKCDACGVVTKEQETILAIPCADGDGDGACDTCGNDLCAHVNKVDKEEVPATCVDTGLTAGLYCNDCEKYLEGGESISATGEHNYNDLVEADDDTHTYKCATCDDRQTSDHDHKVVVDSAEGDKHSEACACGHTGKVDHTYTEGKCACGADEPVAAFEKTTYTIANYPASATQYPTTDEEHVLDDNTTVYTNQAHFTSEIRLYSSSTHNGYAIIKSKAKISEIGFNAGNKADTIAVYVSEDEGATWTKAGSVTVTSSYKDYTLNLGGSYNYIKLDVEGTQQVRIKTITLAP